MEQETPVIFAGDTIRIQLSVTDPETGEAYDLAEVSQFIVAIAKHVGGEAWLLKTFDIDDVPVVDGVIQLKLLPGDTDLIEICHGILQVRVIETDGDEYTLLHQVVQVIPAIKSILADEDELTLIDE
jgi:hypothetical protein